MQFIVHNSFPSDAVSSFADLKLPREKGIFIAEGEKIVERLLKTGLSISSIYLTEEHFEARKRSIELHEQAEIADVFIASKKSMEKIVGFTLHQGILAVAKVPAERTLKELIVSGEKQLFVLLDAIADAENMGTLYRTAQAMGVSAILLNEQSISPWIRRAVRVSMGAVFNVPTVTSDLTIAIQELRANGIQVYAATISDVARAIAEVDFTESSAIVFGSEGYGIKGETLDACQGQVIIPMSDGISSLNVAIAQGIVLYEVMRQRNA